MLRIATIVCALTVFPAASFAAHRADSPGTGGTVAKVVSCDVTSSDRQATFYARMDTIAGASKMQLRFQLLERLGKDDTFAKLDVPALKLWQTSKPGVKRFGWKQAVDNLHVGGAYRAHVQYRWLAANGSVIDTESRDTPICRGPLPNIAVGDLSTKPGQTAETRTYKVAVTNTGKVDADEVDVQLSIDKAVLDTVTLTRLAAGETRFVSFNGPPCRRAIRVKADPGNSIGESIEDDNSQLFACP